MKTYEETETLSDQIGRAEEILYFLEEAHGDDDAWSDRIEARYTAIERMRAERDLLLASAKSPLAA
jgi:hypothetical protein